MNPPSHPRRGRPALVPTGLEPGLVETLAARGQRHDAIAVVLGIAESTLRKHFPDELQRGYLVATAAVARTLYAIATDPTHPKCVTAAIFWLKARAGWRDGGDEGGRKARNRALAASAHVGTHWEGLLE